ncbi:phosphatase PAP2 family protein [Tomitella biformata]|uniref:phosphatase PAP2 family protein n=1 Tax=Tomitella biformata TaxID=630403 RepID=UPI000465B9C2|nr:phosphatase PAP2 family protein [Tomitella biformata]
MNANLSWEQSGVLAAALIVLAVGLGFLRGTWARKASPLLGEAALVVALYSLWQLCGVLVRNQTAGAYERGQWLLDAERYLPLPAELGINHAMVPYPLLTQAANLYYATMHFGAALALLVWLYLRHRDRYAGFRTVLAVFTAISFAVSLVPVAPPRLIAGAGFVDTADQYGQSVYSAMSVVGPNQLAAMPSVHVGWAALVGVAVVVVAKSPWRWLALAHPVLTMLVVVATANHYWLDGIVAVGLLAATCGLWRAARQVWERLSVLKAPALEPQSSTQS